jgi:hypothetical protein
MLCVYCCTVLQSACLQPVDVSDSECPSSGGDTHKTAIMLNTGVEVTESAAFRM